MIISPLFYCCVWITKYSVLLRFSPTSSLWKMHIHTCHHKLEANQSDRRGRCGTNNDALGPVFILVPRTVILSDDVRFLLVGYRFTLHCFVSDALEPPSYINWYYGSEQLLPDNRHSIDLRTIGDTWQKRDAVNSEHVVNCDSLDVLLASYLTYVLALVTGWHTEGGIHQIFGLGQLYMQSVQRSGFNCDATCD